jgi:glutamate-1-semialdehyde 2,1-aminomutase
MLKKYTASYALLERAKKSLAGGVSSEFRKYGYPHALFYSHGMGSRLYDVDQNEYLDFALSQGPMIVGHSNPMVLQAINNYSARGQLFAGQHILEIELAEKLQQIIPSAELMRFCLDGSEAVQTAFRIARAKTGKNKFLRFEGHYHGWLDNVAWGISAPSVESLGAEDNPHVFAWSQGVYAGTGEEFFTLPWNNISLVSELLAKHHHEIAAIITEPIMCNNGCIEAKEGFLQELRNLCTHYNITLIFDEVITGFRLSIGGAQLKYGITPDLSVFAKAMASGYPISAIVGKKEWMGLLETGAVIHAGTMNSSNPTVAAALATIKILQTEGTYERMYALGNKLIDGLRALNEKYKENMLVQGPGPVFHIGFTDLTEVKDYRSVLMYSKEKLQKFVANLHNNGVRILSRGLWYISTIHNEKDINKALEAAEASFQNL